MEICKKRAKVDVCIENGLVEVLVENHRGV